jgi:hypothetical protein
MTSEQLGKYYSYSVFKSLSIIGRCPVNTNIPIKKIITLQMGPRIQNGNSVKNSCNNSYKISAVYRDHFCKQDSVGGVNRNTMYSH